MPIEPDVDQVVVTIDGRPFRDFENINIESGIFSYPSAFGFETGSNVQVADFLAAGGLRPNMPFTLSILGLPQFSGVVDNVGAHGDKSRTTLHVQGRDILAALRDGKVRTEKKFENESPEEILKFFLKEEGLDQYPLLTDYAASRKTRSGIPIISLRGPRPNTKPKARKRHATIGMTILEFLNTEFHHAGLFLWVASSPTGPCFILSTPDPYQQPIYRLENKTNGRGNVEHFEITNDTVGRFAEYVVYGAGGKVATRFNGDAFDAEMVGWGYKKIDTARDTHITSSEEASFYASRRMAEHRRAGWKLEYTVSGLTTLGLDGTTRAVWTPDTMVMVDDDVLGIHGPHYLEHVAMSRGDKTSTRLRLMRANDLLFGVYEAPPTATSASTDLSFAERQAQNPNEPGSGGF